MRRRLREHLRALLVRHFVFDAVADVRVRRIICDEVAERIRRELVCCYAYDGKNSDNAERGGHGICYWGEAGARLAEYTVHERVVM